MLLLVGLGNPGASYEHTRHNAGFMAVDSIIHRHHFSSPRIKFQSSLSEGEIGGEKILIQKPLQYMNLSGGPVKESSHFYKIPPENVVVFHDDIDLPLGKIKVKIGGGHGGHNGLKSLDSHIGKEYWRIRIGVGHPGNKDDVSDYVLSAFSRHEAQELALLLEKLCDTLPVMITEGKEMFMTKLASN